MQYRPPPVWTDKGPTPVMTICFPSRNARMVVSAPLQPPLGCDLRVTLNLTKSHQENTCESC